jgi:hypothetical protein
MSRDAKRYCVVTPYYKEERDMLVRCMDSVRRQGLAVDHMLVADGFAQDWIDREPVRHQKLDRAHGDYGNFARGVGALAALAEGYDGICFLDADNWYDEDHVAVCLEAAARAPTTAFVAARRRFVRPDHSVMAAVRPAEAPFAEHVDTNCMFLLPGAYPFVHRWCTIPRELSASGDQLFYLGLVMAGLAPTPVSHVTVNYLCMFDSVYRDHGEVPPPGAKPILHWADRQAWIDALSPEQLVHVRALVGLNLPQNPARRAG